MNSPEAQTIPAIQSINEFILNSMDEVKAYPEALPKHEPKPWDVLKEFFLSEIGLTVEF